MKKLVAVFVVLALMVSFAVQSYAESKSFDVALADLQKDDSKTNAGISDIYNATPNNASSEMSFVRIASANGDKSGDKWYAEGAANRFATYTFNVASDGLYTVSLSFLTDWNFGVCQIIIDDIQVGLPVDTNNSSCGVATWNLLKKEIGTIALKSGTHTVTAVITGLSANHDWTTVILHSLNFDYVGEYADNCIVKYEMEDQTVVFDNEQGTGSTFTHDSFTGKVYYCDLKNNGAYSFEIDIATGGTYQINLGYLADWNCVPAKISVDDTKIGTVNMYKQGGWALSSVGVAAIRLDSGKHTVTIEMDTDAAALNTNVSADELNQSYVDFVSLRAIELDEDEPETNEPETNVQTGDAFALPAMITALVCLSVIVIRKKNAECR